MTPNFNMIHPVVNIISMHTMHKYRLGDFVFIHNKQITSFENAKNVSADILGISAGNVVEIDLTKTTLRKNDFQLGGKFPIITEGEVIKRLPAKWKIPRGQTLYLSDVGNITWRYSRWKVGVTTNSQDSHGYISIYFRFNA